MELQPAMNNGAGRPEKPPTRDQLPIEKFEKEIREGIRNNTSLVLIGETGSGKSTCTPEFILKELGPNEKAAVLQPRKVAVRSVAKHVADRRGERIGQKIGYQVRFDKQTGLETQITFMTDGLLLRRLQMDPLLSELSLVMVDEAHERSVNIDITLGLLKRAQRLRQEKGLKPLKILVASATIEEEKFANFFSDAPIVKVPGRLYPITVHYLETAPGGTRPDTSPGAYMKKAADWALEIINQGKEGDILIFMPGKAEVEKTLGFLETAGAQREAILLPLYGELSPEDQDKIFEKTSKRKIIVSTNIAETSLTIPTVKIVIDSGLIKQKVFDPITGIEGLPVVAHAQSGCNQRAGRAGRVSAGDCYRLCTEEEFAERAPFQTPEIARSNLDHVVLLMKKTGINDIIGFDFIDPPSRTSLAQAIETLKILGALDEEENLTEIGEVMADLPLKPELARMVIEAQKSGTVDAICTICAFIGLKSVFNRPKEKAFEADAAHRVFKAPGSDFLTFLNVWKAYESQDRKARSNWAHNNFLSIKTLEEVREIRLQLFQALQQADIEISNQTNGEAVQKAIAAGMVGNLMASERFFGRSRGFSSRRLRDQQAGVFIHPGSSLFGGAPDFYVSAELRQTSKLFASTCQTVNPEWLAEIAPHFLEKGQATSATYDPSLDIATAVTTLVLRGTEKIVSSKTETIYGTEATNALATAMAIGRVDLPCVSHNQQIIRIAAGIAARSKGQIENPTDSLALKDWYRKQLGSAISTQEAEALGDKLFLSLNQFCPPEKQAEIERFYPATIQVGGTAVDLQYSYRPAVTGSYYAAYNTPEAFKVTATLDANQFASVQEPQFVGPAADRTPITWSVYVNHRQLESTDPQQIRNEVNQELIKAAWNDREYSPAAERLRTTNYSLLEGESLPSLKELETLGFEPVEYARSQDGKPHYAYPTFGSEQSYNSALGRYEIRYTIRYEPTPEAAQRRYEETRAYRDQEILEAFELKQNAEAIHLLQERIDSLRAEVTELQQSTLEDGSTAYRSPTSSLLRQLEYTQQSLNNQPSSSTIREMGFQVDSAESELRRLKRDLDALEEQRAPLQAQFQTMTDKMAAYFQALEATRGPDFADLERADWESLKATLLDKTRRTTPVFINQVQAQLARFHRAFAEQMWSREERELDSVLTSPEKIYARCLELKNGQVIVSKDVNAGGQQVSMPKKLSTGNDSEVVKIAGAQLIMENHTWQERYTYDLPINGLVITSQAGHLVFHVEKSDDPTAVAGWKVIAKLEPTRERFESSSIPRHSSSGLSSGSGTRTSLADHLIQKLNTPATKTKSPRVETPVQHPTPVETKKEEMTEELRATLTRQFRALSQCLTSLIESLPNVKTAKPTDLEKKQTKIRDSAKERRTTLNAVLEEAKTSTNVARLRGLLADLTGQSDRLVRDTGTFSNDNPNWSARYREMLSFIPEVESTWDNQLKPEAFERIAPELIALAKTTTDLSELRTQINDLIADGIIG